MHPPDDKRVHYKEAVSLVNNGFDVVHVCPHREDHYDLDGVEIIGFEGKRSILGRIMQMPRLYKMAAATNADVYHCNEFESWAVGVWLKWFRKAKLIFDAHEIPSHDFAESRFPKFLHPLVIFVVRMFVKFFLLFTDQIVLAKKTAALDFAKTRVPQVLVQNFTDLTCQNEDVLKPANSNEDWIKVVHLGAINRVRGWPQMLDAVAAAKNKKIFLHVIGKFGDNSDDEFLARVKELGLEDRVRFDSWIPYDEVYDALLSCDVGIILFQPVMLNFTHALPHKLFDYMLAKLPVIVPDFAIEVRDIVKDSEAGFLVDPTNIDEVAGVLDQLADDKALRETMGENGYNAVFETYNWQNEEQRLIDMYRAIEDEHIAAQDKASA